MKQASPISFPPFDFLQSLAASVQLPDWLVAELQNRVVLFANHVLMQEPQAQERLRRQAGKVMLVRWGVFDLRLAATPAGLLERTHVAAEPDLSITLVQTNPLAVAQAVMTGQKPDVSIQGDVALAADVAWLADNLRWDLEEDLSRFLGDAAAHTLVSQAQALAAAVRGFVSRMVPGVAPGTSAAGDVPKGTP